jgi:hypothetical protein
LPRNVVQPPLRENGDAVEALLPTNGDVVAEALEPVRWEYFVDALDLLQAQNIRLGLAKPRQRGVEPRLNAIDVPSGDLQAVGPSP